MVSTRVCAINRTRTHAFSIMDVVVLGISNRVAIKQENSMRRASALRPCSSTRSAMTLPRGDGESGPQLEQASKAPKQPDRLLGRDPSGSPALVK